MEETNNTPEKITFAKIEEEFHKVMLIEDKHIVRLLTAVVVANQMRIDPVWLMVVAASSGGKSYMIGLLDGLELRSEVRTVVEISDVTENTFASGFRRNDSEASLLHKMPYGGIFSFKDFTSILSKRRESREVVMSQLREIYDGKYDKHTGTGDDIGWTGKIGVIAGVTEVVYEYMESMSAMGDRFIMYGMEQPDRRKLLDFVLELDEEGKEDSRTQYENLRFLYQSYLRILNMQITHERITFDTESKEDIKNVADFCTKARSGVVEDFRTGAVKFVPSKEMPTRMVKQLLAIASGLVLIRKADGDIDKDKPGQLQQSELNMLYKIAFDSIPIKRRMALRYLTKYSQGVITEGLAMKLNYQTDVVRAWLSQLNALGIVKRVKENAKDKWSLRPEYQELMSKFNDIKILDEGLGADSDSDMDEEADEEWERGKGMMTDEELEAKLHYEMEAANQFESLANYDKENEQSKRDDERRETNKSETF